MLRMIHDSVVLAVHHANELQIELKSIISIVDKLCLILINKVDF